MTVQSEEEPPILHKVSAAVCLFVQHVRAAVANVSYKNTMKQMKIK